MDARGIGSRTLVAAGALLVASAGILGLRSGLQASTITDDDGLLLASVLGGSPAAVVVELLGVASWVVLSLGLPGSGGAGVRASSRRAAAGLLVATVPTLSGLAVAPAMPEAASLSLGAVLTLLGLVGAAGLVLGAVVVGRLRILVGVPLALLRVLAAVTAAAQVLGVVGSYATPVVVDVLRVVQLIGIVSGVALGAAFLVQGARDREIPAPPPR